MNDALNEKTFEVFLKNSGKYPSVDSTPFKTVTIRAVNSDRARKKAEWQFPVFKAESVLES
jgi:hypothetical protein